MTEAKLIKHCIQNKEKAVRALFSTYAPFMMAIARRYVYSEYDADDILQDAFMKILKNLNQYDQSKGAFKNWLAKIVVNEALMYIRKKKRETQIFDDSDQDIISGESNDGYENLKSQDLMKLLDSLPEGKRIVFSMYAIDGFKHNEIAEKLNISEGTSKSQYAKAKKMLQEEISNLN